MPRCDLNYNLVPLVSEATDLGPVFRAILEHPDEWVGTEIPVVGDVLTIPQIAEIYTNVKGKPARAVFVDHVPQESLPSWTERHKGYTLFGVLSLLSFLRFLGIVVWLLHYLDMVLLI